MARTVSVALKLAISQFTGPAATVISTTKAMGGEFDTLAKTSKAKFNDVAKVATGAGLAMLGIAAYAVKAAYTFDKEMSEVQAVSGATADQFDDLRAAAIAAGKQTMFSATDAATAEAELAKAGVSTGDILHGALSGSLALAAAGQMDLADAATISAQAMNIFGLKGTAVTHIADVLASASNASAADMTGLGDSIKQGGLIAAQTGLSLEDTVGVLSAFADHALVGSDAGTSLKTMLQALSTTAPKTVALMKQLGINAYDDQGKFIGITKLAGQFQTQLSGLTQEQRNAAMAQIFGSDATRAATILYDLGAKGLQSYIDKVDVSGAAAKTAAAKMNNLAGDVEQLKGSVETLAIESGGGATKGLRTLTEGATGLVNTFIAMPPAMSETLTILAGAGGIALLAAVGFLKAKSTGADLLETLTKMGPAGETAAGVLGKIGGDLGKLALVGGAALIAYEGIHALVGFIDSKTGPTVRDIDKLTSSLASFSTTGEATGELAKTFGTNMTGLAKDVKTLTDAQKTLAGVQAGIPKALSQGSIGTARYLGGVGNSTSQMSQQATVDIKALDAALTGLATNGQTLQASSSFAFFTQQLQSTGMSIQQIDALFPQYIAASSAVSASNQDNASSLVDVKTAAGETLLGMDDLITQGNKLSDVMDSLSGANENYAQTNIGANQALADLSKQLKENDKNHVANRKSLSAETQAGRDNLNGILDSIDADKKQFQSKFAVLSQTEDQTDALQGATAQYDQYIARLRASLLAEGFSATAVDKLIAQYAAIPPVATTVIKTPGLVTANDTASGYARTLNDIPSQVTTDYVTRFETRGTPPSQYYHGNRWGGVYQHAADGLLSGASTYSATNPGRYMIAEPQTGGEAFVPRKGNYGRSMSILGQAAGWYGASVVPGGRGGGGGTIQLIVTAAPGAAAVLTQQLRFAIGLGGGNVQKVVGK